MLLTNFLKKKPGPVLVKDVVGDVLHKIERMERQGPGLTGITTGFNDLDRMLSGLHPGELLACLSRPAMGKTAFAASITAHVAKQKVPVLYFSLGQLTQRNIVFGLICAQGKVDRSKARCGMMDGTERSKFVAGVGIVAELPIYIDSMTRTVQDVERIVKKHVAEHKVKLIVIDPLQCIEDVALLDGAARYKACEMVTRRLKAMAVRNEVTVFVTSWLSRRTEEHEKTRPLHLLSQIAREEGGFDVYADVVLQLYREDYYEPKPENLGIAEIRIIKSPDGYSGSTHIRFNRDEGVFFDNLT